MQSAKCKMQNAIINTRRKVHTMEQPRRGELFIEQYTPFNFMRRCRKPLNGPVPVPALQKNVVDGLMGRWVEE
jgi:hypothetical protein